MYARSCGFTLIELLIACSIIIIGTSLAVPEMRAIHDDMRMHVALNSLHADTMLARSEAVKRHQVVLIKARNGSWNNGWDVFVDSDNDSLQGPAEPSLHSAPPLQAALQLKGNPPVRLYIRYHPNGRARLPGGAFQAGTLSLCHESGQLAKRQLILSATGRLRQARGPAGTC
jgi:type IV fimbrial biogenesis protein FimT